MCARSGQADQPLKPCVATQQAAWASFVPPNTVIHIAGTLRVCAAPDAHGTHVLDEELAAEVRHREEAEGGRQHGIVQREGRHREPEAVADLPALSIPWLLNITSSWARRGQHTTKDNLGAPTLYRACLEGLASNGV